MMMECMPIEPYFPGRCVTCWELSTLDMEFGDFICRVSGTNDPVVKYTCAILSCSRRFGSPCLHLEEIAGKSIELGNTGLTFRFPDLNELVDNLIRCDAIGTPGEQKPVILHESGRLYLHRYWEYEQLVAREIAYRALGQEHNFDEPELNLILSRFFQDPTKRDDAQCLAAKVAISRNLCVITGGPGTGKTHTLIRVIASIIDSPIKPRPRVALAAPTGKAAARLVEMVKSADIVLSDGLRLSDYLTESIGTLHRLLGASEDLTTFKYNAANLLPYDVVAVDEASMVDLALMARLLAALPRHAKLILCGDRNQLASVEPGSVFTDICAALLDADRFSDSVPRSVVQLTKNYRFRESSLIHQFSEAVVRGDVKLAEGILEEAKSGRNDLVWFPMEEMSRSRDVLREEIVKGYHPLFKSLNSPKEALRTSTQFRILCPFREGPFGVVFVNRFAEWALGEAFGVSTYARWLSARYPGQLIIVTRNDYSLRLFNGDCGVILRASAVGSSHSNRELVACFPSENDEYRMISPVRLPSNETAFAITIHKSQGSEFDEVLILLPKESTPLLGLNRELVYTAVTRAKNRAKLSSEKNTILRAIMSPTSRESGLREAILREFQA